MGRGLALCSFGQVQLSKEDEIDVAQRAQRMRVLQRDDRHVRLAKLPQELGAHVVRAPGARLRLDHVLQRTGGSIFVAALDRFGGQHEEAILRAHRLGIELDRVGVLVERARASLIGRARVARPQERGVRFILEAREKCLVRGLVRRLGSESGGGHPEGLG